jgi:hypothetical protein
MNIGILQDSREDWEEAAATMAGIYENAHITIAATASKDSNGGLFSSIRPAMRRLNQHPHLYVRVPLDAFPVGVFYERPESLPLLSRAWVYQERRLSPRTIHFGKDQVYWECQTQFASEDAGEDRIWETHDTDFGDLIEVNWGDRFIDCAGHWQRTVTEYTSLRLTFESDRLPAIAALADRMSQLREKDDVYISGIWKKSILSDLLWCTNNNNPRPVRNAPSWSWASTQGSEITWDSDKFPEQTEVVSVKYTAIGAANLGEVINASIILRAYVLNLTRVGELVPADMNDHSRRFRDIFKSASAMKLFRENNLRVIHSRFLKDYDLATANPPYIPGRVIKLLVTRVIDTAVGGIVVQQTPNDAAEYERIGFLRIGVSLMMYETPEEGEGEWQKDDVDWKNSDEEEGLGVLGTGDWYYAETEKGERIDSLILSLPMEVVKIV